MLTKQKPTWNSGKKKCDMSGGGGKVGRLRNKKKYVCIILSSRSALIFRNHLWQGTFSSQNNVFLILHSYAMSFISAIFLCKVRVKITIA